MGSNPCFRARKSLLGVLARRRPSIAAIRQRFEVVPRDLHLKIRDSRAISRNSDPGVGRRSFISSGRITGRCFGGCLTSDISPIASQYFRRAAFLHGSLREYDLSSPRKGLIRGNRQFVRAPIRPRENHRRRTSAAVRFLSRCCASVFTFLQTLSRFRAAAVASATF